MDVQIWSKSQEKRAHVLALRGNEVSLVSLSGNMFTLKKKLKEVIERLEAGDDPSQLKAGSVATIDAASIARARVSPGNDSLTLHGGPDGSKTLSFPTADGNASEILQAILGRAGRSFQSTREDIGVFEAIIPPAIVGGLGGLFWMGTYDAATRLASGEAVEATGRRQGMKRLLIGVADTLGTTGTIAVGVGLLALVLGWAFLRITRRPQRTVWLPDQG
ncbi:hypothetical protein AB1L88_18210 [Tautonia sp. JC769]|uniref:hypothetical protein n=1 Tax=Tautonia sp. JC769 TaxID=3232135 RepID=UPI003459C179